MKDAVLPSLIGRPQDARMNTRPLAPPNPANDLARGISALGPGAERLGFAIAGLVQERDEADYRRTLNDAVAAADARMQSEVFSQEGFAAKGVSEKAASIYQEVAGEYGTRLSGRNARRFAEAWGARRNAQVNSVLSFERGQLRKAQLGANASLIKSETANFIATGDDRALEAAKSAYDDTVRLTNGGHLVSNETIAAFDADVKDGDGHVKLPDGRSLRIVDADVPPGQGAITRKQIARIRENMVKQAEAYHKGLQNLYDAAHAGMVQRYLDNGDLVNAEKYLEIIRNPNHSRPVSEAALTAMQDAVTRKRKVWDISTTAAKTITEIQAEAGGESAPYGSPEQDRLYFAKIKEISGRNDIDPKYKGMLVSSIQNSYRLLKEQQKAKLTADILDKLKMFQDGKFNSEQQRAYIEGLPDSPLKDALAAAHRKQMEAEEKAFNNNTDPAFLLDQESKLNSLKLWVSQGGKREVGGVEYDFSNKDQVIACAKTLGLTERSRKRFVSWFSDSNARLDADLIVKEAAKQLGVNSDQVFKYVPYLMARLEDAKGSAVIEPAKMREWIRSNVTHVLSEELSRDKNWWPDSTGTLGEYIKTGKDFSPETLYMTEKQFDKAFYMEAVARALRNNDVKRAQALLKRRERGVLEDPVLEQDILNERKRFRQGFNDKGKYLYLRGSR